MRPSLDSWSVLGYVALLMTLLLSGPGVKLVRADDALVTKVPVTSDGPVCSVRAPIDDDEFARVLAEVQQEVVATQPAGPDVPIALNNRGYNYGPSPENGLEQIRDQLGIVVRER